MTLSCKKDISGTQTNQKSPHLDLPWDNVLRAMTFAIFSGIVFTGGSLIWPRLGQYFNRRPMNFAMFSLQHRPRLTVKTNYKSPHPVNASCLSLAPFKIPSTPFWHRCELICTQPHPPCHLTPAEYCMDFFGNLLALLTPIYLHINSHSRLLSPQL